MTYDVRNDDTSVFRIRLKKDGAIEVSTKVYLASVQERITIKKEEFQDKCLATNHDIFLYNSREKVCEKNSGYEYDTSNEEEKACNDVIKLNKDTIVYEKPAIYYNEVTTLKEKSIVKRTNKEVNEVNGHIWDKVVLSNNKEGYVFTENINLAEEDEYVNIKFEYSPYGLFIRKYDVYFPTVSYGINIEDYPYYIVTVDNNLKKRICYGKTKFNVTEQGENYHIGNGKTVLMVTIETDGNVLVKKDVVLGSANNTILIKKESFQSNCLNTNQDIYYQDERIYIPYIYEKGICYKMNIGWDDIMLTENNYETIKKGEEEFSSVDKGILEEFLISEKEKLLIALRITNLILPHGSTALDYFLTLGNSGKTGYQYLYEEGIYKTGHTMRKIPLDVAIEQSSSMKEKLEENIDTAIKVVEKMNIPENAPIIFNNVTEDSGKATRSGNLDWYITLHWYRIKMRCKVIKNGDNYQMSMTYGIIDYYDWENQEFSALETLLEGSGINPDQKLMASLNAMHRIGIARNYTNYGEVVYNITWNEKDKENTLQYSANE